MSKDIPQLKDQSLWKEQCYVNGKWIGAKSGKTFEVISKEPDLPVVVTED